MDGRIHATGQGRASWRDSRLPGSLGVSSPRRTGWATDCNIIKVRHTRLTKFHGNGDWSHICNFSISSVHRETLSRSSKEGK